MLCSLAQPIVQLSLGSGTAEEIGELIRKDFVQAMENGKSLCIDIDKTHANFATYESSGTFDASLFFNTGEFEKREKHMAFVRDSENNLTDGSGGFFRSKDFTLTICSSAATESDLLEQIALIPNFADNF